MSNEFEATEKARIEEAFGRLMRENSYEAAEYRARFYKSIAIDRERDCKYYRHKLGMIVAVFEEARDALPAITFATAKLRGIRLDLADRMDRAGTYDREMYDAEFPPQQTDGVAGATDGTS